MEKTEYSPKEVNQMKWQVYRQLPLLEQNILVLYQEVKENGIPWEENRQAELVTIADVLCNCALLFAVPSKLQDKCGQIRKELERNLRETEEQGAILENLFETMQLLEEYIGQRAK
ncbi:MAG: hypothetical protein K2G20_02850, partial [Lachnospiraceae bacterium]|nr:hypothetical protein [Lachnospiraceae bacterium]